jgi:zinc and cadmium transporter
MIFYALISVSVVSLVSLIGVLALSMNERALNVIMHALVGLAAGALLGDAFVHLIPEAFEGGLAAMQFSLTALAGMIVFFILEKYLRWHHHEHEVSHAHIPTAEEIQNQPVKPLGKLILVGDGVHNFVDGVVIAASYSISLPLGIATTIAVLLHEIPQEISDFALLLHAGYTRARAALWNFISALTAILGALAFFALGDLIVGLQPYAAAFTAGAFIYIAAADLVPELHETKHPGKSAFELSAMLLGIALMFALLALE